MLGSLLYGPAAVTRGICHCGAAGQLTMGWSGTGSPKGCTRRGKALESSSGSASNGTVGAGATSGIRPVASAPTMPVRREMAAKASAVAAWFGELE
jgi:hypothetical protein